MGRSPMRGPSRAQKACRGLGGAIPLPWPWKRRGGPSSCVREAAIQKVVHTFNDID
nr:MAG TPA: hypothetical protein [Inoviridae sp.]